MTRWGVSNTGASSLVMQTRASALLHPQQLAHGTGLEFEPICRRVALPGRIVLDAPGSSFSCLPALRLAIQVSIHAFALLLVCFAMAELKAELAAHALDPGRAEDWDRLNPLFLLPVVPVGLCLGDSMGRRALTVLSKLGGMPALAPRKQRRSQHVKLVVILFLGLIVRLGPACAGSLAVLFPSLADCLTPVGTGVSGLALVLMAHRCHLFEPANRLLCILLLIGMLAAIRDCTAG